MPTPHHVSASSEPPAWQARLLSWLIAAGWVACGGFLMLILASLSKSYIMLHRNLELPIPLSMRWLHPIVVQSLGAFCMGVGSFVLFRSKRFQTRGWTVTLAIAPPLLAAGCVAVVFLVVMHSPRGGIQGLRVKEPPAKHATRP